MTEEVASLKETVLEKIQQASKCGEVQEIIRLSGLLEEIEEASAHFQRRLCQIKNILEGKNMETIFAAKTQDQQEHQVASLNREVILRQTSKTEMASSKLKAKKERKRLEDELRHKGITLNFSRSTIKYSDGYAIGAAFATERKPNQWFLGLPDLKYKVVVLMCENNKGQIVRFFLGKRHISEIHDDLSQSEDENLKFNIRKEAGNYSLLLNGRSSFPLNDRMEDLNVFDYL